MKNFKKLLAFLMACIVSVMPLPVSALEIAQPETEILAQDGEETEGNIVTSGFFGADGNERNVMWNFDEATGTLTISGTGEMRDCVYMGQFPVFAPWADLPLQKVVIEEGITNVGDQTFEWDDLTSVVLPESVTTIGHRAFYSCSNLSSVSIPESVTNIEIGEQAFLGTPWFDAQLEKKPFAIVNSMIIASNPDTCTGNLVIPESITTIGNGAFSDCTNLTSVIIPESVTTIGDGAFSDCTNLTSVTIPESVTTIGGFAFSGCTNLTSMTIPESVITIDISAFSDCENLTSITIPDSVKNIEDYAFENCLSLTSVTLSKNITHIGTDVFSNTPWLNAQLEENSFVVINSIIIASNKNTCTGDLIIPEGVTTIGNNVFSYCENLTSVSIPEGVTTIGNDVFSYCENLTSVSIPEGVITIGDNVLEGCNGLTSVTIPESVTNIGAWSFSGCNNLTSVIIPENVTTIGYSAFGYCEKLASVTISENVTNVGDEVFLDTPWADAQLEKNPILIVGSKIIVSNPDTCTGDFAIPDNVTAIGRYAFSTCDNLTSITIPESVTNIGVLAFWSCENLTKFIVENPDCIIAYYGHTICNEFFDYTGEEFYGTIYGYENSTAQIYADNFGYHFELIGSTPAVTTVGDLNADDKTNAEDSAMILTEAANIGIGQATFTEEQTKMADVNQDGVVNAVDASVVLTYAAENGAGVTSLSFSEWLEQ